MKRLLLMTAIAGFSTTMPVAAATISGWNTSNIDVGSTPSDFETGASIVYDQALTKDAAGNVISIPAGATTSGKIVFTPPEAVSPGVVVSNEAYQDSSNPAGLLLDGCIKTSSEAACDDGFQSGKRVKQVVTDTGPMDLVFNLGDLTGDSTYQVFGRLINQTAGALDGFKVELGYGVGSSFEAAAIGGPLTFSTEFTAQPGSATNVTTQYPFGLFGDALSSPNFILDGFFDDARTGLNVTQTATSITGSGYYGNYEGLFGDWMSSSESLGADPLPEGVFWDFDNDPETDNLLMAWQRPDGQWEVRRTIGETCGATSSTNSDIKCGPGVTLAAYEVFGSKAEAEAFLTAQFGAFDFSTLSLTSPIEVPVAGSGYETAVYSGGPIEDLANLNLNYAIRLGDLSNITQLALFDGAQPTFTLRTTVFASTIAAVPLPATAPLLLAGLGMFGFFRKRRALV